MVDVGRVWGTILSVLLAVVGVYIIVSSYVPSVAPYASPYREVSSLLLGYRVLDIIGVSFLVFAAIMGVAALFRPEKLGGEE